MFTRSCDSLGHRPACSLAPVTVQGTGQPVHSPKGLARARESSIVDVNKYPDWTNVGRASPLV